MQFSLKKSAREHMTLKAVVFGLIVFPVVQGIGLLFMQEGIITFWIDRSLKIGVVKAEGSSAPEEPAPEPDTTRHFAVMFDNHPGAWPQEGLEDAQYVWEVLVEGGITRLMAVFRHGDAEKIGPVRSARPYFLEYAREYDAVYAHVGGSDESLRMLRNDAHGLDDADQFRFHRAYWRDQSRYAPHNTYTSFERMRALIEERGWRTESEKVPADVRSETHPDGAPATTIEIEPSGASQVSTFAWNEETQSYDREDHPQSPATVVVMKNDAWPGHDPLGKGIIAMETTGAGDAVVFRNGVAIESVWKKESLDDQTQFYLENGEKVPFSPGQVWFHVIAPNRGGEVVYD